MDPTYSHNASSFFDGFREFLLFLLLALLGSDKKKVEDYDHSTEKYELSVASSFCLKENKIIHWLDLKLAFYFTGPAALLLGDTFALIFKRVVFGLVFAVMVIVLF